MTSRGSRLHSRWLPVSRRIAVFVLVAALGVGYLGVRARASERVEAEAAYDELVQAATHALQQSLIELERLVQELTPPTTRDDYLLTLRQSEGGGWRADFQPRTDPGNRFSPTAVGGFTISIDRAGRVEKVEVQR